MHTRNALLLVVLVGIGACGGHSFDRTAEQQQLLRRDAQWADLASAGKDVEKILAYWSEDAQVIEPGQPVYQGKAAIRAYVLASLSTPGFKIHWVSAKPVFSPDGKLAYMPGVEQMTLPGANGVLTTVHMHGISIWRRDPDGEWRCVVDIANEAPTT
ncbi:MAG: YybH family protein [Steroidobacteraceae bacterium]